MEDDEEQEKDNTVEVAGDMEQEEANICCSGFDEAEAEDAEAHNQNRTTEMADQNEINVQELDEVEDLRTKASEGITGNEVYVEDRVYKKILKQASAMMPLNGMPRAQFLNYISSI